MFMIFVLLMLSSCQSKAEQSLEQAEIKVAAASNFLFAFEEIGSQFEEKTGVKVIYSFGSSGQLAEQIGQGAPFHVFASANKEFLIQLEKTNRVVANTMQPFALGRVGIAVLPEFNKKLTSLEDLLHDDFEKIAIANPEHAPYGKAAKQALEANGLWDKLEGKMVYARNVSDALTYVQTKNAEAAFIALSLAKDDLHISPIDSSMHEPLHHAAAIVTGNDNEKAANAFIDFLLSEEGQVILAKYGFARQWE